MTRSLINVTVRHSEPSGDFPAVALPWKVRGYDNEADARAVGGDDVGIRADESAGRSLLRRADRHALVPTGMRPATTQSWADPERTDDRSHPSVPRPRLADLSAAANARYLCGFRPL